MKKVITTTINKFLNENQTKTDSLTDVILLVRDKFNCSYEEINQGKCVDFVDEVIDIFQGKFETLTTSMFVIDDNRKQYLISNYKDTILKYDDVEWSKNMLEEFGYPGEDLMGYEPPKHIWIYYEEKHYDVEAPNGVNNPWNLPIFAEYNWF